MMVLTISVNAQLKVDSNGKVAVGSSVIEKKYFERHPEIGGDVVINKMIKEVKNDKSLCSFEIAVPVAGDYYINFWLCPSKLPDGSFSTYEIYVNDSYIGKINPSKSDWQNISVDNNRSIYLNNGINTVSVVGSLTDTPLVESVRLSKNPTKGAFSDTAYRKYKEKIIEESHLYAEEYLNNQITDYDTLYKQKSRPFRQFPVLDQSNPPYLPDFVLGVSFKYTFYTKVYLSQGQNFTVSTTRIDNFPHVLEFFKNDSPELYSWSNLSYAYPQASINTTIPATGYYTVRVRSYYNCSSGLCNLNINNQALYDSVAVYSNGIRGEKDINTEYTSFTCYNNGDPVIWVEEGGMPGIITAYNDDYLSNSNTFYWGHNSRIKKQYSSNSNAVLISSYSSFYPSCSCDFYINSTNLVPSSDENYLISAPFDQSYNCVSWCGGIYTMDFWPPYAFANQGLSPLEAFDYFFSIGRYYGCSYFTRDGATTANSVIDLWAIDYGDTLLYKHTTIKKGADNNAHGYAWESKLGYTERAYHPRNNVPNAALYGQVYERYRRVNQQAEFSSLEESIANGRAVIETVHLSKEEQEFVDNKTKNLSNSTIERFEALNKSWNDVWKNSPLSNPDDIADCSEYRNILEFCKKEDALKYYVFKKLNDGNNSAVCLVKDLSLNDNKSLLEKVWDRNRKEMYTDKGAYIVRSYKTNALLYVKELIKQEIKNSDNSRNDQIVSGVTYSNMDDFSVCSENGGIKLTFEIQQASKIYADVIDLNGKIISIFVKNVLLESSQYTFCNTVPKGIYLVRYIVNGNVNVKKIAIE